MIVLKSRTTCFAVMTVSLIQESISDKALVHEWKPYSIKNIMIYCYNWHGNQYNTSEKYNSFNIQQAEKFVLNVARWSVTEVKDMRKNDVIIHIGVPSVHGEGHGWDVWSSKITKPVVTHVKKLDLASSFHRNWSKSEGFRRIWWM